MGLSKREHLVAMLSAAEIASRWEAFHGDRWTDDDVDTMYREFVPLQLRAIEDHAELVPHLLETVAVLRSHGLPIGGTTGYFREAAQAFRDAGAHAVIDSISDLPTLIDRIDQTDQPHPLVIN